MSVGVLGAGAFGTALALALARGGHDVTLWARDPGAAADMVVRSENARHLPGHLFPDALRVTGSLARACAAEILLLAMPMQALAGFAAENAPALAGKPLVACAKGVDLATGQGPSTILARTVPDAIPALLSGPSFAIDIAAGLPTALTLAAPTDAAARALQDALATPALRLYRSTDVTGVELGGALKNVIAIACGLAIGAGLGDSARAALLTRGFAEMQRYALARGAQAETLAGLSGLGDLVLTATSEKSRNFAYGVGVGRAGLQDPTATTEGIATARALARTAEDGHPDMPVTRMVAAVLDGRLSVAEATEALLARPLTTE